MTRIDVRSSVESVIGNVLRDKGQAVPDFSDEVFLMRAPDSVEHAHALGLDSLDVAQTIVQLERDLGMDPFRSHDPPRVRTLAELVSVYEAAVADDSS